VYQISLSRLAALRLFLGLTQRQFHYEFRNAAALEHYKWIHSRLLRSPTLTDPSALEDLLMRFAFEYSRNRSLSHVLVSGLYFASTLL